MKYEEEYKDTNNINEFIEIVNIRYKLKKDSARRMYYKIRKHFRIIDIMKKYKCNKKQAEKKYHKEYEVSKFIRKKEQTILNKTENIIKEYDNKVLQNNLEEIPINSETIIKPNHIKMLEIEDMKKYNQKITDNFLIKHGFKFEEIVWLKNNGII